MIERKKIRCGDQTSQPALAARRSAMNNLGLNKLFVIYPGSKRYTHSHNVEVLPVAD